MEPSSGRLQTDCRSMKLPTDGRFVYGGSMNLKAERGAATRDRVLAIATRLFADRGYDDTSIEVVLQESGLSRGALYHHYAGKDALFEAVLEATESAIGGKIRQAVRGI